MIGVSLGGSFPQGVPAPSALLDAARHAEASGFDAIWSGDHVMMYSPIVECVTLLVPVAERGSRTDEGLEIVRRLWTERNVSFRGRHWQFEGVTLEPPPVQRPHPPIWIGGRSTAALRRTARFADG
jgi:alkanesulfonate monooxygenase SsuD/methylene tetrahydromethanopterin reductase-like flavin-dependent oxidoreductase (luciferase family)